MPSGDIVSVKWSVPCRNARFFKSKKKTGARIKMWIVDVIMPPTIGAPAIAPVTTAINPSRQFHAIVKCSKRFP